MSEGVDDSITSMQRRWYELSSDGAGHRIASTIRFGHGIPIVLLHGFGSSKEDFSDLMLRPEFLGRTLLAYDAPGFGETVSSDLTELSIPLLRNVAEVVIARHGWSRYHLVGHSMGGLTALLVALRNPDAVVSFTNIEGNLAPEDCFLSRQVTEYPTDDPGEFLAGLIDRLRRTPAYSFPLYASSLACKVRTELIPSLFHSMVRLSADAALLESFVSLPTQKMFVHGSTNRSLSYLETLRRNGVRVTEIPQSGHFPMYANPSALWARLGEFLAGCESREGVGCGC